MADLEQINAHKFDALSTAQSYMVPGLFSQDPNKVLTTYTYHDGEVANQLLTSEDLKKDLFDFVNQKIDDNLDKERDEYWDEISGRVINPKKHTKYLQREMKLYDEEVDSHAIHETFINTEEGEFRLSRWNNGTNQNSVFVQPVIERTTDKYGYEHALCGGTTALVYNKAQDRADIFGAEKYFQQKELAVSVGYVSLKTEPNILEYKAEGFVPEEKPTYPADELPIYAEDLSDAIDDAFMSDDIEVHDVDFADGTELTSVILQIKLTNGTIKLIEASRYLHDQPLETDDTLYKLKSKTFIREVVKEGDQFVAVGNKFAIDRYERESSIREIVTHPLFDEELDETTDNFLRHIERIVEEPSDENRLAAFHDVLLEADRTGKRLNAENRDAIITAMLETYVENYVIKLENGKSIQPRELSNIIIVRSTESDKYIDTNTLTFQAKVGSVKVTLTMPVFRSAQDHLRDINRVFHEPIIEDEFKPIVDLRKQYPAPVGQKSVRRLYGNPDVVVADRTVMSYVENAGLGFGNSLANQEDWEVKSNIDVEQVLQPLGVLHDINSMMLETGKSRHVFKYNGQLYMLQQYSPAAERQDPRVRNDNAIQNNLLAEDVVESQKRGIAARSQTVLELTGEDADNEHKLRLFKAKFDTSRGVYLNNGKALMDFYDAELVAAFGRVFADNLMGVSNMPYSFDQAVKSTTEAIKLSTTAPKEVKSFAERYITRLAEEDRVERVLNSLVTMFGVKPIDPEVNSLDEQSDRRIVVRPHGRIARTANR